MKHTQQMGSKKAKLGRYAFFLSSIAGLAGHIHAQVATTVGLFTFETSLAAANGTTTAGSTFGPLVAESGVGTAFASHATNASFNSPAGNGSTHSFGSSGWITLNDYYQFSIPSTGVASLTASFDIARSNTGPTTFAFEYSTDGGTSFSTVGTFGLFTGTGTATGVASFSTGASNSGFNVSFNLSTIAGLNDNANDVFRVANAVTAASGGTARIDNFQLAGTTVPEPSTLALLSVAGAGAVVAARRRKNA